ncbi:MAG: hypothetical protein Q7R96_02185 [Nanoarchaeota archaeon]|nr:hypothetical protein [Nanoarchaeota archaeon]
MSEEKAPPLDLVRNLRQTGLSKDQIIDSLQRQGFSMQSIDDAFTQADIQGSVDEAPIPQLGMQRSALSSSDFIPRMPASSGPSFQQQVQLAPVVASDNVQEIVESVIEEKWRAMREELVDFSSWKDRVRTEIIAVKQELLRLENRFETLQGAVLGKVQDYDKNIADVGTEIKALEKVLSQIIQPLTQNVRDLGRITEELKKR